MELLRLCFSCRGNLGFWAGMRLAGGAVETKYGWLAPFGRHRFLPVSCETQLIIKSVAVLPVFVFLQIDYLILCTVFNVERSIAPKVQGKKNGLEVAAREMTPRVRTH